MQDMPNLIGRIRPLSREERKELRARRRFLRKLGAGIKLCGALTRQGRPCIMTALKNGRCKMHGGASKGPKTEEGRAKAREALRRYWENRRHD